MSRTPTPRDGGNANKSLSVPTTHVGGCGYRAGVTDSQRIDDILHRVNNLLGTIEIQSEVARTIGTTDALTEAIDHIVESARKTRADLDKLRGSPGAGPSGA